MSSFLVIPFLIIFRQFLPLFYLLFSERKKATLHSFNLRQTTQ